jgi:hypothetical protein
MVGSPSLGYASPTALQNKLFSSLAAVDEGFEDIPPLPELDELAVPLGETKEFSGWQSAAPKRRSKDCTRRKEPDSAKKESADTPAWTVDDSPVLRGYGTREPDEQQDFRKHSRGEGARDHGFQKVKAREFQKAKRQAQRERGD